MKTKKKKKIAKPAKRFTKKTAKRGRAKKPPLSDRIIREALRSHLHSINRIAIEVVELGVRIEALKGSVPTKKDLSKLKGDLDRTIEARVYHVRTNLVDPGKFEEWCRRVNAALMRMDSVEPLLKGHTRELEKIHALHANPIAEAKAKAHPVIEAGKLGKETLVFAAQELLDVIEEDATKPVEEYQASKKAAIEKLRQALGQMPRGQ